MSFRITKLTFLSILLWVIQAGGVAFASPILTEEKDYDLKYNTFTSLDSSITSDSLNQNSFIAPKLNFRQKSARKVYEGFEIFRQGRVFKPYFSIGVDIPNIVFLKNSAVADFTSEFAKFNNMRVGLGFRLHHYFGVEVYYNDIQRIVNIPGTPLTDAEAIASIAQGNFPYQTGKSTYSTRYVSLMGHFYTPAIDLKYGSLEFTVGVGMAYYFGSTLKRSIQRLGTAVSKGVDTAEGVKLILGAGVVLSFKQYASIKFGVDFVIINDHMLNVPMVTVMSLTLNLHPF